MTGIIEQLSAIKEKPEYLPCGLPANWAAIHKAQLARAPLRVVRDSAQ